MVDRTSDFGDASHDLTLTCGAPNELAGRCYPVRGGGRVVIQIESFAGECFIGRRGILAGKWEGAWRGRGS